MHDLRSWNRPIHYHGSLDNFCTTLSLQDGIHVIAYCGVFLEINLYRRSSRAMLVFFNAALASRNSEVKLPAFSGTGAPDATDACVLLVSDPVLYLDKEIRLSWYAGALGMHLQVDLARVLQHIQHLLNINKVILYGASGGGFAALFYAPFLKNAIAVPCNPQINMLRYSKGLVSKFLQIAFKYKDDPTTFERAKIQNKPTMNITVEHMRGTRVLYLQNALDKRHFNRDFLPYLQAHGFSRSKELVEVHSSHLISVCGEHWGEGHRAPPAKFVYSILHNLTSNDGWDKISSIIPKIYKLTANRFRQVLLRIDGDSFYAQAWLHTPQSGDIITVALYRNSEKIETIQIVDSEIGQFSSKIIKGTYRATAQIDKHFSIGNMRNWRIGLMNLFRQTKVFDEIRSQIIVVP